MGDFDRHFQGVFGTAAASLRMRLASSRLMMILFSGCARIPELPGERWPQLRSALQAPTQHVCWLNPFAGWWPSLPRRLPASVHLKRVHP